MYENYAQIQRQHLPKFRPQNLYGYAHDRILTAAILAWSKIRRDLPSLAC